MQRDRGVVPPSLTPHTKSRASRASAANKRADRARSNGNLEGRRKRKLVVSGRLSRSDELIPQHLHQDQEVPPLVAEPVPLRHEMVALELQLLAMVVGQIEFAGEDVAGFVGCVEGVLGGAEGGGGLEVGLFGGFAVVVEDEADIAGAVALVAEAAGFVFPVDSRFELAVYCSLGVVDDGLEGGEGVVFGFDAW